MDAVETFSEAVSPAVVVGVKIICRVQEADGANGVPLMQVPAALFKKSEAFGPVIVK